MKKNLYILLTILIAFSSGFILSSADELNHEDIKSTLKTLGLSYTTVEIDSVQESLLDNLDSYEQIRAFEKANSLMPATVFSPYAFANEAPTEFSRSLNISSQEVELPRSKDDLAFYSIRELAYLLENQKITPLELTQVFLKRIREYDDTLKAFITVTEKLALKQAQIATEEIKTGNYKGILHGIPYGVKDLLSVEGYPTTWGAGPFRKQQIDESATVVQKLNEAGAILLGKLSLGALAYGDIWFDAKTKNPWNLEQGSSGSSAGPAAATEAGLVAFAIGSETLGSIVSPSTRCGLSGLRPSFGGISRHGAMALSWSMDKLGPMARSAEDCAIIMHTIAGADEADPFSVDYNFNFPVKTEDIKLAYVEDFFSNSYNYKNDSLTLNILKEAGFELQPIEWFKTDLPVGSLSLILTAEAAAAFDQLTLSNADDDMQWQDKNAWPNIFRASRTIPAVEYINANRIRSQLIKDFESWINQYDAVVVPSFSGNQLLTTNLSGHPAVVLENGFLNGSPSSFTIIGKHFSDDLLLSIASKFQENSSYHLAKPPYFE